MTMPSLENLKTHYSIQDRDALRKQARALSIANVEKMKKSELVEQLVSKERELRRLAEAAVAAAEPPADPLDIPANFKRGAMTEEQRRIAYGEPGNKRKWVMPDKNVVKAAKDKRAGKRDAKDADRARMVITLLVKHNPRRPGSATFDIFKLYKNGQTVADFIAAGGRWVDVIADVERKHIKIDKK